MKTLLNNKTFLITMVLVISIAFAGFAEDAMYIDANGNVGIGTNAPSAKLDVFGRFVLTGAAENLDPGANGGNIAFLKNSAKLLIGWNRSAGAAEYDFIVNRSHDAHIGGFRFIDYSNAGVEKLLVTIQGNNGNVGIGVTWPQEKLEVAGNIKVNGHIKLGGFIYSAGGTYFLAVQDDGNLVMYRSSDNKPIWSWMTGKIN